MKPDSNSWQPEWLSASEDRELARSLGIMKQQVPDASQLAALAAQLVAQGLPVTGGTPAAPLVRSVARLRRYSLIVGAAVVGVGGAIILLRRPSVESRSAAQTAAAPVGLLEPIASGPSLLAERARPGSSNPLAKPSAAAIASSSQVPDAASEPFAEPTNNAAPRAGIPQASRPSTATSTARSAQESATGGIKAPRSTSAASVGSGPEPGAVVRPSELTLLRDARLALHSSPAQALALTEQHGMLYPRGAMAQERELIAISALASLGRHSAALARVADFERDFPNSPYRKQVTQLAR